MKTRNKAAQTHFNLGAFLKNNWAYFLGLALVSGGAYLSYYGAEEKFANLMHTDVSWNNALPSFDFQQMGVDSGQQFSLSGYHAWLDVTKGVEVYNGNYTDWCWKCLDSIRFKSGSIEEGGEFTFRHCPGVPYESSNFAEAGELVYTSDYCPAMFNYFDQTYAYWAGVSNDDYYYTPPLDPLTLTEDQQNWAVAIAVLYASVNAISAAPATKEVIKRISDSFSNHPEEILPGKRHKVWNAVTLFASTAEAFVRTLFAAVAAWYVLQSTDIDESYLWTIVGFTWISTALNYIIPLDDAYSKIPVRVGKSVQVATEVVSKSLSALSASSYVQRIGASLSDLTKGFKSHPVLPEVVDVQAVVSSESSFVAKLTKGVCEKVNAFNQEISAAITCDEYIDRINKMIGTIENAPKEVVQVMHREMIS